MSSIESSIVQTEPKRSGMPSAPLADRPSGNPHGFRQALDVCVRFVRRELASENATADFEYARQMLGEVADMVRFDGGLATDRDYDGFLRRLTRIYADGCEQRDNDAFAATAAGYAAVVEAVSRRYPRYDYSGPLGHLLEYMTRLFGARDNRWKVVYKHLRAIPDSVSAKQNLMRACSADIREWFDAGVQNLFSLQRDLASKIQELAEQAEKIDGEIRTVERTLTKTRRRLDPQGLGKVVVLEGRLLERQISALQLKRGEVLEEKTGREGTLGLIESDIREFEGILREARRSYYLRIV